MKKKTSPFATTKQLKQGFNTLDQKIDSVEKKLNTVEKRLDQKIDAVDMKVTKIAIALVQLDGRVGQIEYKLDHHYATKDDINRIVERFDAFAGEIKIYNQNALINQNRFSEIKPILNDHESRIQNLEKAS